jgi:cytochrome c-type biogenesis protein CcmE
MTRKQRRMILVVAGMASLSVGAALVLSTFSDNLVFFYSPTDVALKQPAAGRMLRIGGLVEDNSVTKFDGGTRIEFKVTDGAHDMPVSYTGVPPSLFREGQGVVAEGRLDDAGMFRADTILAKHDERYMPAEVVEALKKSGQWREDQAASAAASPALVGRP